MASLPATLLDFLISQLDRRLKEQCSDQGRYRLLILQGRVWRQRLLEFQIDGRQPFASGDFGELLPIDFMLMLTEIDLRMSAHRFHADVNRDRSAHE